MAVVRNPDVPRPKISYFVTPSRVHSDEEMLNVEDLMSDQHVRRGFVLRVLSILLLLYSITAGIICVFHFTPVNPWLQENVWYWYIIIPLLIFGGSVIACCGRVRYKRPWNWLFLVYVTLVMSAILAGMSCYISTFAVASGLIVMGACYLGYIILAVIMRNTTFRFHIVYIVYVFVIQISFILLCLFLISTNDEKINAIVSGMLGFVFMIILAIDACLIFTGRYYYPILPDEYILGATHLYIDTFIVIMLVFNAWAGK